MSAFRDSSPWEVGPFLFYGLNNWFEGGKIKKCFNNMDITQLLKDWFSLKLTLCSKKSNAIFKQQELWWCSLGANLGEEIFGKGEKFTRPILIFKKFTANKKNKSSGETMGYA